MYRIRENVDLKELEKYGFIEYGKEYSRKYKCGIITCINKETRIIEDIDIEYKFMGMLNLGESTRVNDLIKADLVEKVSGD